MIGLDAALVIMVGFAVLGFLAGVPVGRWLELEQTRINETHAERVQGEAGEGAE